MANKLILFVGDFNTQSAYVDCLAKCRHAKIFKRERIRTIAVLSDAMPEMTSVKLIVKTVPNDQLCDDSAAICRVAYALGIPVTTYNKYMGIPDEPFAKKLDRWLAPFMTNPQKIAFKGGVR